METRVTKNSDNKIKKLKQNLMKIIEEIEDNIPEVAE